MRRSPIRRCELLPRRSVALNGLPLSRPSARMKFSPVASATPPSESTRMAVSTEIRQVEKEIDESIKALPLWRRARERVVRASLDYYRSASEVVMLGIARAALLQRPELFESAFLLENRIK